MTRATIILAAVALALTLSACEAFQQIVHETVPPPDQLSPSGTVLLFKQAADSSDTEHAVAFFCTKTGKPMSAMERYDYSDELQRYLNRIRGRYTRVWDVKGSRADGDTLVTVNVEFDWLFFWQFKTRRIGTQWYISEIQEDIQ